jgi:putative transposase
VSRFRFVGDHADQYSVKRLCRLVEVSRSGYYAWRARPVPERRIADAFLANEIRDIHARSRGTYGAPRIMGQLRRSGYRVGKKRVARLMSEYRLVGAHTRRRWRRGHVDVAPAGDLLNRNFDVDAPNRAWVADITEFVTDEGKLYLAGVRDLYSRTLVGWSMGTRATAELVIDALVMAVARRNPEGPLVHHADHGSQYTSIKFTNHLDDLGLVASYGSVGDAYDNAAMETFWATLKREIAWIYGTARFATQMQLRTALFEYIEVFYNRERHQAALDHHTPSEFELIRSVA